MTSAYGTFSAVQEGFMRLESPQGLCCGCLWPQLRKRCALTRRALLGGIVTEKATAPFADDSNEPYILEVTKGYAREFLFLCSCDSGALWLCFAFALASRV